MLLFGLKRLMDLVLILVPSHPTNYPPLEALKCVCSILYLFLSGLASSWKWINQLKLTSNCWLEISQSGWVFRSLFSCFPPCETFFLLKLEKFIFWSQRPQLSLYLFRSFCEAKHLQRAAVDLPVSLKDFALNMGTTLGEGRGEASSLDCPAPSLFTANPAHFAFLPGCQTWKRHLTPLYVSSDWSIFHPSSLIGSFCFMIGRFN